MIYWKISQISDSISLLPQLIITRIGDQEDRQMTVRIYFLSSESASKGAILAGCWNSEGRIPISKGQTYQRVIYLRAVPHSINIHYLFIMQQDIDLPSLEVKRKNTIQFQSTDISGDSSDLSQSTIMSSELNRVAENFSLKKIEVKKTETGESPFSVKNVVAEFMPTVIIEQQKILFQFSVSMKLIELLIEADIQIDRHSFSQHYIQEIASIIQAYRRMEGYEKIKSLRKQLEAAHYILYLHTILANSNNLQSLTSMTQANKVFPPQKARQYQTNILDTWSLFDSIQGIQVNPATELQAMNLKIIISEEDVNKFNTTQNQLIIGQANIYHSLMDKGHLDIHFSCFVLNLLPTNQQPYLLSFAKNPQQYCQRYAEMFLSIIKEKKETSQIDIAKVVQMQIQKLVKDPKSDIKDIRNLVLGGVHHPQLERALIGMLGWEGQVAEETIKLLNAYYDHSNWQIRCEFTPVISQVGENFRVDYLIDKQNIKEEELVFMLMSPSLNPKSKSRYTLTWHHPILQQYVNQDHSYLWCTLKMGKFTKAGLYDWKLVRLNASGKITSVNKILNMEDYKSSSNLAQHINKIKQSKSVQGRFIVHPEFARDLQLHEVCVDLRARGKDQGDFKGVQEDLDYYRNQKINTIYLAGVLERDFGPIYANGKLISFRKTIASPLAVPCRTTINSRAGGEEGLRNLIKAAKEKGIKIIIDCVARVSSSRTAKKYLDLLMHYVDGQGKLNVLYGSEGRAVMAEDTVVLNYRRKETWELFLEQISYLIAKFEVDGIHIDNGQSCPQIFRVDREELYRKQMDNTPSYSIREIFEGKVVLKDLNCGYWAVNTAYPNPFYIKFVKELWKRHPNLLIIADTWGSDLLQYRGVTLIHSGLIPRVYKITLAVNYTLGQNLHKDGRIDKIEPKNVNTLKKWYSQRQKFLPKGWIVVQSTSSCTWPYTAYMYKKASWAAVDLFFFLPDIPMTYLNEQQGEAFKNKNVSMIYAQHKGPKKVLGDSEEYRSMSKMDQAYFTYHSNVSISPSFQVIIYNTTVRQANQIPYLQQKFIRDVGPQYGFNLQQIHKHYQHRRHLRSTFKALRYGNVINLQAQHQYGYHSLVLSFARSLDTQILLIAINFNQEAVDMYFGLKPLKNLFPDSQKSDIVIELKDVFNEQANVDNFYTINDFLNSKLEYKIKGYGSVFLEMILHLGGGDKFEWACKCSTKRLIKSLTVKPQKWIYSSNLTNNILLLLDRHVSIKDFANHFIYLFQEIILQNQIDFNQMISQTHQFWTNKSKTNLLFGYLKKLQLEHKDIIPKPLNNVIDALFKQNKLGPIAFVTPEIGQWSCVGGLAIMVDELSKQLAKIGEQVIVISPYYEYNKKGKTNYLVSDGFKYVQNIEIWASNIKFEFGIHYGVLNGVKYVWLHNPQLFSMPYKGQDPFYVTKQLVFFALASLEALCQLKLCPSTLVTNDWFCGFVPGYIKVQRYGQFFKGCKVMHIVHNLDPLYEGRLYPKPENGDLNWLIQLPRQWIIDPRNDKVVVNPSRCALSACDNWGTVSHSYKVDLLKQSPLADVLWKYPNPFSFPNGVRKSQRMHILQTKTPGNHNDAKRQIQTKYFKCSELEKDIPVFSFVGRVTKQKGVHLILDVIERLLYENNFKMHFLIGGPSDSRQQYGKYCAQRMVYLANKYPHCVWASPNTFFEDGPLINIGSDFGLMPSLFEPGGIVQHQFFSGSTPVISFRTGGLKDTVIEYNYKTGKGNGFNFMNYDSDDFRNCIQRALNCFKIPTHYEKLRQNALESVIDVEDVAKAWNNEFHRLHNKIFIQWNMVDDEAKAIQSQEIKAIQPTNKLFQKESGRLWSQQDEIQKTLTKVLINAQRLKAKPHDFIFYTEKLPRPREVCISGSWDGWKQRKKLKYQSLSRSWKLVLSLEPGTYVYKYMVDDEWVCSPNDQIDLDITGVANNTLIVE